MDQTKAEYRKELENELEELQKSNDINPSEYKTERIERLRNRLVAEQSK